MTPAEEYAQKRAEAEALIRQHAPERLQAPLIELLRPAIGLSALRADDADIPLGASKFGGTPDVPQDFEWPTWDYGRLSFLAQINLEEVTPFDVENRLPKSGLLSFFLWIEENPQVWGQPEYKQGWRVLFFHQQPLSRYSSEATVRLPSLQVTPWASWTLPFVSEAVFDRLDVPDEYVDFYDDFSNLMSGDHLVGWPRTLQDPVEVECEEHSQSLLPSRAEDWRFLFQMDSQASPWGEAWPSVLLFSFCVLERDLKTNDFSNAWLVGQAD